RSRTLFHMTVAAEWVDAPRSAEVQPGCSGASGRWMGEAGVSHDVRRVAYGLRGSATQRAIMEIHHVRWASARSVVPGPGGWSSATVAAGTKRYWPRYVVATVACHHQMSVPSTHVMSDGTSAWWSVTPLTSISTAAVAVDARNTNVSRVLSPSGSASGVPE